MKFVRFISTSNRNPLYQTALRSGVVRKMDLRPTGGNITLDFLLDGQALALPMVPVVRDLVDLAAMVYVADELLLRNDAVDHWSRTFDAVIPVRSPAAWRRATPQLTEALHFLSGDTFNFKWSLTKTVPRLRNHRAQLPEGFDTVCLFSGGADSLVGAFELLEAGRSVLLVGHQAEGITSSTQDRVFAFFKNRFGDRVAFVQARVGRSPRPSPQFYLGKKVEVTHRPRSFLFLALAVALAAAADISEIVIPENGLIAINPPLNISRAGTLSTRTAHPRFIAGFSSFIARAGIFDGRIHNPFMYLSKTDVVRRAPRALRSMFRKTLSCSHLGRTRWDKFSGYHCGYCVPCLFRRVALSAIGLDDPQDYFRNVFTRFNDLSANDRADVAALASFATRVSRMSTAQRIATAISHGACAPETLAAVGPAVDDPYAAWATMLSRWSEEFLDTTRGWASRDVRRRLNL
jgi:7-cyano-7-deazaguanine synthase in queuosine biosynthesis